MLTIIIPVFNEAGIVESSLDTVFRFLHSHNLKAEIIVVSNGSTDDTNQILEGLKIKYSGLRVLTLLDRAVGSAFVSAVEAATFNKIITLDVDLSSDLSFIIQSFDLLGTFDIVVGSKLEGSQERTWLRRFGSQFYVAVAQFIFGITVSDFSIGCKGYRKEAILTVLPKLSYWTGYVLEILLYARVKRLTVAQIGVRCVDKRKSHFNLFFEAIYRYFHLFRTWIRFRLNPWI